MYLVNLRFVVGMILTIKRSQNSLVLRIIESVYDEFQYLTIISREKLFGLAIDASDALSTLNQIALTE